MKISILLGAAIAVLAVAAAPAVAQSTLSAEQIIERMERNTVFETSKSEGAMIVRDRFGTKESTFISYARGEEETLIEFTNVEDRGIKILRTEDEIYLFYPDAQELIRLQGAALRDSVLGSDMSYEDMTGEKGLLDSYRAVLQGTEPVEGRTCYRIELEARRRNVPYYRQTVWVDTELFIYRRVHKLSRSGRLLKEVETLEIETIEGRNVVTRMLLKDTLKRNSSTEFVVEELELDIPLPADTFSLRSLTW